jgi:amidohydrolase
MNPVINLIKNRAKDIHPLIVSYRRHFHQHPELSFEEFETSNFIKEFLIQNNIPFKDGYVKTGIVASVKGNKPGKTILLRADMDALPILEQSVQPYSSKNTGVMHACGHDVHSASLMGTALILNDLKEFIAGEVKFIFQPGEEVLPGGASLMIKEGALGNPLPVSIMGQHVFPQLEVGKVGFRKGKYMASTDEVYITVKGKGGHGAMPHLNIDPITTAAQLIIALQQLVSRLATPDIPTVLSFGKIIGNGATNVIPDEVKLEGTFRTFDEEWRNNAHHKIREIAQTTAAAFGASCEVNIVRGYPFLVNDNKTTQLALDGAVEYLGEHNVVDLDLRMTAEDFAYYSQLMPACFYRLGTGNNQKGITSNVHTATFDIDEKALEVGSGLMAYLAIKQLM